MLNCKEVSHLASDYLDRNLHGTLSWQIRLHLLACKCCRRFMRHLKITTEVLPGFVNALPQDEIDAQRVLQRIKDRTST